MTVTTRTVIGGVGYRNLRDHSLGIVLSDELEPEAQPPSLLVEDLCYGPVAVGQWLLDEARDAPITRAVFVTAVAREDGRAPGTISVYRWDHVLPPVDEIHRAMMASLEQGPCPAGTSCRFRRALPPLRHGCPGSGTNRARGDSTQPVPFDVILAAC